MKFEFNPDKDASNKERHGISLEEASALWEGTHLIIPAKNVSEPRFAVLGKWHGKLYVAIFTRREENIRIISCHRADKRWERIFYEQTKKKG